MNNNLQHVERITYDYSMREKERDYGYWFMDMDINSLRSVDKIGKFLVLVSLVALIIEAIGR